MDNISMGKQYTTREGFPYRCYATDSGGDYPVHGAVILKKEWIPIRHTEIGRFSEAENHQYDLIEVKPRMKIERWIAIDSGGNASMYLSNPPPVVITSAFAIKHIVFEVEEGEGLR